MCDTIYPRSKPREPASERDWSLAIVAGVGETAERSAPERLPTRGILLPDPPERDSTHASI
jgi:hypothetical protein